MTELFTMSDTKDIQITNNHKYFIQVLKNKYRLFTFISVDGFDNGFDNGFTSTISAPAGQDRQQYINPYSEITIIKSSLISTIDISVFFMWHLDIIISYFLQNNIDISYSNLQIYKEYIHKYGYSSDYEIYKLQNKIQNMTDNEIINLNLNIENLKLIIENLNLNKLKNDVLKSLVLCIPHHIPIT